MTMNRRRTVLAGGLALYLLAVSECQAILMRVEHATEAAR